MTIISLLRGINLGAHRRIKMDALRACYEQLRLTEPQTYLQSGNVIFQTAERSLSKLTARIEQGFETCFGFHSDVVLRTAAELRSIVDRNPFAGRTGIQPDKLLVHFLAGNPATGAGAKLELMSGPEELHLIGRELYIHFANGMARPNLRWTAVDKALQTPGTGRNWNSVLALLRMAEDRK